jgi:hypothetical protein
MDELIAFREAYEKGDDQMVHEYYDTKPNYWHETPYHYVIRRKSLDAMKLIYELEKKNNQFTYNARIASPPIHIAINYKFVEGVRFLLELPDIDLFISSYSSSTIVDRAITSKTPEILIMVLERLAINNLSAVYHMIDNQHSSNYLYYTPEIVRMYLLIRRGAYYYYDNQIIEDEDGAAEIRYKVHFSRSLTSRLLLCMTT